MTNAAAIGYAIKACKNLEWSREDIKKLESEMYYLMDMMTEEAAEKIYESN